MVEWYSNPIVWLITTTFFLLMTVLLGVILALIKKNTNAFMEWKAKRKGQILAHFFTPSRHVIVKACDQVAGMVEDEKLGTFIVNPGSIYLDKNTKTLHGCWSTEVATNAPIKLVHDVDQISQILQEPTEMIKLRQALLDGDEEVLGAFEGLRESVNFGSMKAFMNAITPHNLKDSIALKVQQRLQGFNKIDPKIIIYIIIALFGIAVIAVVLWKQLGGSQVENVRYVMMNASQIVPGG